MKNHNKKNMIDQIKLGLAENGISARSILAFVIFGMIVLVFVLSDLSGRGGGSGSGLGAAAEVNGELVSLKDFYAEENRISQYYSQLFGGQFDMETQRAILRNEVMNSVVNKVVASQAAEKEGILATDAEIRHMITQDLPYFKKDGQFQSDFYKQVLQANGMTPGEFEKKLRQDIKSQRSRTLMEAAMSSTSIERTFETELRSAKINLEYIQLSASEFEKINPISDAVISSSLADEAFLKRVEADFKANESQYEQKEQVRASHILVRAEPGKEADAEKKAQELLKRVQKEDFGKVASQVSDDPGSKANKGDLGFFTRGRMVPEFENAAFTLPVGKISDLVKSNFGYHIIKVTDKKEFKKADFAVAQKQIAQKILAQEKYGEFIKNIESQLAQGQVEAAVAQLAQMKWGWKETGFFDIASGTVPQVNSQQILKTAFELTKAKPVSSKLIREGDAQFLIRLKDTKIEQTGLAAQEQDLLNKQKPAEAYRGWIENFKRSAKIQKNDSLLTTNAN